MTIESLPPEAEATADCAVCIVGAGPAGITLGIELARRGIEVVIVESGRLGHDARVQALADAAVAEARHSPMHVATRRQWGGTSAIWGGRCLPLDAVDFEPRPARGDAAWPFPFAELARFYPRACAYARCGDASFTVAEALGTAPPLVPGFEDGTVTATTLERWSLPTDFGAVYAAEAQASESLRVYLGMTCTGLEFEGQIEAASRVKSLAARSPDGARLNVRARHFVIAAGGLESTRLLLNADRLHPGGVGNHGGQLGRHYMGHISGKIAEIEFTTDPRRTIYGFERDAETVYCRRRLVVSPAAQSRHGLLNCALWLDNPPLPDATHGNGILSMAYLALSLPLISGKLAPEGIRRAAVSHPRRSPAWRHLWNVLRDLPRTLAFIPGFVFRRYVAARKLPGFFLYNRANRYSLHYHGEQAPRRESRVELSDVRDEFGMRRLAVDLRYGPEDIDSVIETHRLLDEHLQALGIGRLHYLAPDLRAEIDRQAKDGYHQIGTTRMSRHAGDGVVDPDCRIHSMENLYVLSSSVFPTSGQANPTLTVVALALRLADHLRLRLGGGGDS